MHKHILVTAKVNSPTKDPQVIEKWLSDLVEKVNMEIFLPPVAKYCDDPNNAGVTGVVVITTSHASIHLWDHGLLQMDLYSCKHFNELAVVEHVKDNFDVVSGSFQLTNRDPNNLEVKGWSAF
jgi:S-adenosylmethionine/arginine decarboxylase-like enzyme